MREYLSDKIVLNIYGADTVKFLQGLVTKNISNLQSGLTYCLMLNSQGKYLFDLFLYQHDNGFFVEIFTDFADNFISKIKIYKLRANINIMLLPKYKILWSDQLTQISLAHNIIASHPDPRLTGIGYRTIIDDVDDEFTVINSQTNQADSHSIYKLQKYQLALPDFNELIQEKSFPLEYGFERLNAIDFDKGCYIGQELVARTFHRGVVRKNIFKLTAAADFNNIITVISPDYDVYAGELLIGKILSFHHNLAIAQLRIEEVTNAKRDNIKITVMGHVIDVTIPIWRQ